MRHWFFTGSPGNKTLRRNINKWAWTVFQEQFGISTKLTKWSYFAVKCKQEVAELSYTWVHLHFYKISPFLPLSLCHTNIHSLQIPPSLSLFLFHICRSGSLSPQFSNQESPHVLLLSWSKVSWMRMKEKDFKNVAAIYQRSQGHYMFCIHDKRKIAAKAFYSLRFFYPSVTDTLIHSLHITLSHSLSHICRSGSRTHSMTCSFSPRQPTCAPTQLI